MKTITNGILCATLMLFIASCGKDNKSGGGSSSKNMYNSGQSVSTKNVLDKLTNWYNGKIEGYPRMGVVNTQKQVRTTSTMPNCQQRSILGIPYQYCSFNGSPSIQNFPLTLNIVPDNRAIKDKANAELNSVFSGSLGTVIEAVDISPTQSQLTILRKDGTIVIYGINTQRHSSLNPEYKSESSSSQKVETIIL